jgi:hypothetical protein
MRVNRGQVKHQSDFWSGVFQKNRVDGVVPTHPTLTLNQTRHKAVRQYKATDPLFTV